MNIEDFVIVDDFLNQSEFYDIITNEKIKIYFATLPKYMHRISDNININEQSIIGLFLVVLLVRPKKNLT